MTHGIMIRPLHGSGALCAVVAVLLAGACKKEFLTVVEAAPAGATPSAIISDSSNVPILLDNCAGENVLELELDATQLHAGDRIQAVFSVGLSQANGSNDLICPDMDVIMSAVFAPDGGNGSEFTGQDTMAWPVGQWEPQFTSNMEFVVGAGPIPSPSVQPRVSVCHEAGACPGSQCTLTNTSVTLVVVHDHQ